MPSPSQIAIRKSQFAHRESQLLSWQGWSLRVPDSWNPVKVDGDEHEGSLLLADLHAARLGLRWKQAPRRGDAADWVRRSMRDEVGKLAAEEAVDFRPHAASGGAAGVDWSAALLYRDPEPPGRDVFVAHSRASGRMLQVVHHADKRTGRFADTLLPTLADTPADAPRDWAVFDLSLRTPAGTRVRWYRFNAGDLAVAVERVATAGTPKPRRGVTVVRQVGPASLALARQPLAGWVTQVPAATRKLYREIAATAPATLTLADGRTLDGLEGALVRKRRLWWAWMIDRRQTVLAFHDPRRDRLVAGQSADVPLLRELLATVGHASTPAVPEEDA